MQHALVIYVHSTLEQIYVLIDDYREAGGGTKLRIDTNESSPS